MRENSYAKSNTIIILGGGVKQTKQGGLRIFKYILWIFFRNILILIIISFRFRGFILIDGIILWAWPQFKYWIRNSLAKNRFSIS